MKTLALRLYGKNDLRLEPFELPKMGDDEILADITTNSICMSCHKAAEQGADHKRVPNDVAQHPIIIGHEFCGTILEVGKRWRGKFKPGQRYGIQPALVIPGRELEAPGYSFRTIGGNATTILIPKEVMERDCLLPYEGEGFFKASLAEPVSCIVGAFKTNYHFEPGRYEHTNGIVEKGALAILAGAGPMGLEAVDFAVHGPHKPGLLVVTDIDQARLDRAASIFSPEKARAQGVDLRYANTGSGDAVAALKALTGGKGYDDVFVFAPVPALIEQGSKILGYMGCLNFFAGPPRPDFYASVNFYDVHYMGHHVVGSSGGNTDDLREALDLMTRGAIDPSVMVTHIGGLDAAARTILDLPKIPGAKKLIYTQISLPLTAIDEFAARGKQDPLFAKLAAITSRHNGLWSIEAEQCLLAGAKPIGERP
jgi:threonine dehydrogenase-like Zn-dependent dehydrogenase